MGLARLWVLANRLEARRARMDPREWVQARRRRTRHLIELGGLVKKAGLVELSGDDRALLYGALLELADRLRTDRGGELAFMWRERGRDAFEREQLGVE
jgi:hypothetical protein